MTGVQTCALPIFEYLETMGIPVVTFGQEEFPSFYSSKSGFQSPLRIDDVAKIANMLKVKWKLGLKGAALIANPVQKEYEVDADVIEKHIQEALNKAALNNIKGKEVTPFILKTIAEKSNGESLEANIALIKNNAKLAAQIAVSYYH